MGILGQSRPSAGVETLLYTVPSGKQAHFTVRIYNDGASDSLSELYVQANGETIPVAAKEQVFAQSILSGDSLETVGFVLEVGESIVCKSATADVNFTVNGVERSV